MAAGRRCARCRRTSASRRAGCSGGVAYYPCCAPHFDRTSRVPLLILIGDKDDWTPAENCRRLQAGLRAPELVETVYYPNAYH